ncbi:MAG: hypothetical protein WCM76_03275 [Bacteroidota bacterium]
MANNMKQSNTDRFRLIPLAVAFLITALCISCKKDTVPEVSTKTPGEITATTAGSGGNVQNDGGSPVTERGICWSTHSGTTIDDSRASDGSQGTGSYNINMSGLTQGATYYVKAYAMNSIGISYGEEKTFVTSTLSQYANTEAATEIRFSSANLRGSINPNNMSTIAYFEYGTTTAYGTTIAADTTAISGSGFVDVHAHISGLTTFTTYHYRVKMVNYSGTMFGQDMTFTTRYAVGDSTQGGIVVYTDLAGVHGVACALVNLDSLPWCVSGCGLIGTGSAVGTGQANTSAIMGVQGVGNYAAYQCENLVIAGYSDWYLPSLEELHAAYPFIFSIGTPGAYYWTSTEYDADNGWAVLISDNAGYMPQYVNKADITTIGPGIYPTYYPMRTRAVRSF